MHSVWIGEFMGTLVLVLLGNGVNAGVTLRKSYAADSGWMVITTGWALAVLCGVLVAQAFGSAGAQSESGHHAGRRGEQRELFAGAEHVVGAVAGRDGGRGADDAALCAALVAHARSGGQAGRLLHQRGGAQSTGEHSERGHGHHGAGGGGGAIFSHGVSVNGPAAGMGPWLVGSLVWGIGLSLGGTTGYAINPARDLGPRLVHALLPIPGKGGSNWRYAWIPILGDLTGGALAGLLLHYAHL